MARFSFALFAVALAANTPSHEDYKIIESGTCEDSGYTTIIDVKDCQQAGEALQITDYCKGEYKSYKQRTDGKMWCRQKATDGTKGFKWKMPANGYKTNSHSFTRGCTLKHGTGKDGMEHFPTAKGQCGSKNYHCVCKAKDAPQQNPYGPEIQHRSDYLAKAQPCAMKFNECGVSCTTGTFSKGVQQGKVWMRIHHNTLYSSINPLNPVSPAFPGAPTVGHKCFRDSNEQCGCKCKCMAAGEKPHCVGPACA